MPTPLPARNIFDGTALPVTSTMKSSLGSLRDFLAGLLGTTGAAVDARAALGLSLGSDVQAFDADIAKTDAVQIFTAVQRTNETTDNDGSFDLDADSKFKCTPVGAITLTFTNIPASPVVQEGSIVLVNTGGYAVSAHANTKVDSTMLAAISTAGTYLLSYRTTAGIAIVTASKAKA